MATAIRLTPEAAGIPATAGPVRSPLAHRVITGRRTLAQNAAAYRAAVQVVTAFHGERGTIHVPAANRPDTYAATLRMFDQCTAARVWDKRVANLTTAIVAERRVIA